MSKLLKLLLSITLSFALLFTFVGCDDGDGDGGSVTTGEFKFELVESEKDGEADYYKITGLSVSSEDALKMAEGNFESVKDKRDIKIPATYKNLEVKEIGSMAFADQLIIKSVDFEGSKIETIGEGAFSGCASLEEIKNLPFIGESQTAVGAKRVLCHLFGSTATGSDFVSVSGKTNIEDEEASLTFSIPAKLKKISTTANKITECAFYGITTLETVEFSSATEVGANAFSGCTGIISVNLSSVNMIYDGAFEGCLALQEVKFGETLTYVGDKAFASCSRLGYNFVSDKEEDLTVTLPNSVTYLGEGAFSGCSTLEYIVLGSNIKDIKSGSFSNCIALKKVKILSTEEVTFRANAFSGCDKEKVVINKHDGTPFDLASEVFGKPDTTI